MTDEEWMKPGHWFGQCFECFDTVSGRSDWPSWLAVQQLNHLIEVQLPRPGAVVQSSVSVLTVVVHTDGLAVN